MTGAPEKHQGEAVEQEASNFVSGIASIAMSSAVGQHDQDTTEGSESEDDSNALDDKIPDPTKMATRAADAKTSAAGDASGTKHDKTKKPMEEVMWTQIRPVMHGIGDVVDGWERFSK